jgi:dihydrofolate reductase
MTKYVVTSTLTKLDWSGSEIIKGNVGDEIKKLKKRPGKDLLLSGSAQLFNAMMRENLIDLYRFMVHPVVLGKGMKLFADENDKRALDLKESRTLGTGIVILEYVPAG